MIKELKRTEFPKLIVSPEDSITLYYQDRVTKNNIEVCRYNITEATYFDIGIVFWIDGEDADRLGIKEGYGGIFGKVKK